MPICWYDALASHRKLLDSMLSFAPPFFLWKGGGGVWEADVGYQAT